VLPSPALLVPGGGSGTDSAEQSNLLLAPTSIDGSPIVVGSGGGGGGGGNDSDATTEADGMLHFKFDAGVMPPMHRRNSSSRNGVAPALPLLQQLTSSTQPPINSSHAAASASAVPSSSTAAAPAAAPGGRGGASPPKKVSTSGGSTHIPAPVDTVAVNQKAAASAAHHRSRSRSTATSSNGSEGSTPDNMVRSPRSGLLHPKDRKCCFCIPWSSDPNKRLSFVTIIMGLVVFLVALSCVMVWLLGYFSTLSMVAELTSTIRASIMHDVSFQCNQAMAQPLQAAYDIEYLINLRFPDLADRTTSIMTETGWLSDLSYVAMRYPALSRVGFATRNNMYVLITKGIAANGVAEKIFSASRNLTVSLCMPEGAGTTNATLLNYRPTPLFPPSLSAPPFALRPEVPSDASPADIARYLGTPFAPSPGFNVLKRPFYKAAEDVAQSEREDGGNAGWSNVYSSNNVNVNSSTFLAIAAVYAHTVPDVAALPTNPNATALGFATFAVTNLDNLNQLLRELPLGQNGMGYFIRTNGRVVSSSVPSIIEQVRHAVNDVDMFSSDDPWLRILAPILLDWDLVTTVPITPRNSSLVVPYRDTVYERSVSFRGDTYHVQAAMISNITSGLPLLAIIVTKDSDFDANVRSNITNTVLFSCLVAVLASALSWVVTRCVSRPMMSVVDYMERACKIIEMERSAKQRKLLNILCEEWAGSSGMMLPPLMSSAAFVSMVIKENPSVKARFTCGDCCDREKGCSTCGGVGRSLREVQSMHRAFGSMLYSLASYDELEAINHAKRQFIRYIFHEVRVPFNAIVLGIEQMEIELREHYAALPGALDTLGIISEQSQVVSRILNDVLSLQKIEDGALILEYDVFSMEKMIKGSLYAFRSPCMDKKLRVKVSLTNIDELVARALPAFKIGHIITPMPAGGNAAEHGRLGQQNDADEYQTSRRSRHAYMHRAYVKGDPYRLRQVFSNLITNSIKFSPMSGRITVTLEAYNFKVSPYAAAANASLIAGDGKYSLVPPPPQATHSQPARSPPTSIPVTPREAPSQQSSEDGAIAGQLESSSVQSTPLLQRGANGEPINNIHAGSSSSTSALPPRPVYHPPQPLPDLLGTLTVRVSVRDAGPGVPASEASHLFQAYQQVAAGKTQKGNGTGLGLSISKSIVELHGGQIGFVSRSEDGRVAGGRDTSESRLDAGLPPLSQGLDAEPTATGAEFFFVVPMEVVLVKSRSSAGSSARSHVSVSESGGVGGGPQVVGSGAGAGMFAGLNDNSFANNSTLTNSTIIGHESSSNTYGGGGLSTSQVRPIGGGGGGGSRLPSIIGSPSVPAEHLTSRLGGSQVGGGVEMVGVGGAAGRGVEQALSSLVDPRNTFAPSQTGGSILDDELLPPRDTSPSAPQPAHVGLVHRTHSTLTSSHAEHKEGGLGGATPFNKPSSPAALLMQHARSLSNRHSARLMTRPSSRAAAGRVTSPSQDRRLGSNSDRSSHERIDSVVDIAPLAEAGIGVIDNELVGLEPSLSANAARMRDEARERLEHEQDYDDSSDGGVSARARLPNAEERDNDVEHSVSHSVSRVAFHEDVNEDGMDPTRGDWDHIERQQQQQQQQQQQRRDAPKATLPDVQATSGQGAQATSATRTTAAPSSLQVPPSASRPSSRAPPFHPSPKPASLPGPPTAPVSTFLDVAVLDPVVQSKRGGSGKASPAALPSPIAAGASPLPARSAPTSPQLSSSPTDSPNTPKHQASASTGGAGTDAGATAGHSHISMGASTSNSRQHRSLPHKLALAGINSLSSPPPGVSGTSAAAASSSSATMTSRRPAPNTHAIDLASFISDEMREKTRRMQAASAAAAAAASGTNSTNPSAGGGGWVHPSQIHLSPESAPPNVDSTSASAGGGGNSNPSTPFVGPNASNTSQSMTRQQREQPALYRTPCRVLVVEDSLPNRKLLVSLLGRLKCIAHGVEDGQQCVDLFKPYLTGDSREMFERLRGNASPNSVARELRSASAADTQARPAGAAGAGGLTPPTEWPYDIVLMDGTMPVMNGVVATQLLRHAGVTVPIVAVTGNALVEDVEAFLHSGADDVLTKPVNSKMLQNALARFCPPLPPKPNATP